MKCEDCSTPLRRGPLCHDCTMKRSEVKTPPTFDQLVDNAVAQIIRAFGKGEDLRGACWAIVNGSANWGATIEKGKSSGE